MKALLLMIMLSGGALACNEDQLQANGYIAQYMAIEREKILVEKQIQLWEDYKLANGYWGYVNWEK